jgi:hypothetical protein
MHSRRSFLRRASALAALPSLGTLACSSTASTQRSGARASSGESANWFQVDWEREKVEKGIVTDTLVIHHTAMAPGMTWQQLSELQLKNVYMPRYTCDCDDPVVRGQPPHSGHYRLIKGRLQEVFYAYHFIIRQNGSMEALLGVHEVGWHAGNWDVNLRSVAICFDGDFSTARPPESALIACAGLMNGLAKSHPIQYLMGHYEAMAEGKTACPGSWLRTTGSDGMTGKAKLLDMANLELSDLELE